MLLLELPERQLQLDSEMESRLREIYGARINKVLSAMQAMPSRYYFRINTLKARREEIIQSMISSGLRAEPHEQLEDGAFLHPHQSKVETVGNIVEADRVAAEAVQLGAHLYAPGVKRCHGLRPGMKVTVVDGTGTPVGSGLSHQSETSILTYRQGVAVEIKISRTGLPSIMETQWYADGQIHLQSLPAILTSHILDPKPGETIVDLNCAPGGKTSHICQLTGNQARIIGFDRNKQKIRRAEELMNRMGCANYQLISHDSRYVHLDYNIKADRVLVDPPCTALGVIPKLAIETTMRNVENSADYQRQFLTAASRIAKKGGTVVYSVCTISKEECEDVVGFAEKELGLELEEQTPFLADAGFDPDHLTQRFNPDIHETGYFIARFIKN
jgi:16S rRNA C967 or C1407 C5-methylase (RsmB/RsmF family)